MPDLHLIMKAEYFDEIGAGTKPLEYRLVTPYWEKRLVGRTFDRIQLAKGYAPAGAPGRHLTRRWKGMERQTITHPHFGADPVEVFAIDVSEGVDVLMEKRIVEWLLRAQVRDLTADTGHGYRSVNDVARAMGLDRKKARFMLWDMSRLGMIRLHETSNYIGFRTVNPLPWEPGGEWPWKDKAA